MERFRPLVSASTPGPSSERSRSSQAPSLIDERFDHDSCGVGFVASVDAAASHGILTQALTALARLAHRGATAADGKSSDGVGVLSAIPRDFLIQTEGLSLASDALLGVGMVFIPKEETRAEALIERALLSHDFKVLCWRDVPVRTEYLGEMALSTMPKIRQIFVADGDQGDPSTMERRLYLARKQFERSHENGDVDGYICSLSTQTIVYKAMCTGHDLASFYPDLASPQFVTPFAIFHQRYATNTLPTWHRAQPGRTIGHNGEINTVWGNRARMAARDSTLPVECKPVLTQGGTDSTSLDEAVELISQNGRTLAEAMRMVMPPAAASGRNSSFLRYNSDCTEPWDGPAAIAFSNGRLVGAILDRNGLRPCRFAITQGGLVVAGSEIGLVDLDPNEVVHSGRLGPGQMLVVDLEKKRVYEDEELLSLFDADPSYSRLLEDAPLVPRAVSTPEAAALTAIQKGFGYTREDVRMILQPMAADGKDAVWSMGDDTPLAFLARTPRPVYAYFRQRFAQVTNPAIDPLREACVVSLHTRLGPWPHLLDKNSPLPGLSLSSPFLSLGQVQALRSGEYPHSSELNFAELSCVFAPGMTLLQALDQLSNHAIDLVRNGARLLLLTDRAATTQTLPVPMAMATGAVHQALVAAGLRTLTGIAVEAGDARDIHHVAVLIGYGAGAVCPWLALETGRALAPAGTDPDVAEKKMLKALDAGLAKVMSKMGISVVDSYRSARQFDILGLHSSVVERCFPNTPAPISGIGFAELDRQIRQTWHPADGSAVQADLPDYGWVRFRKAETAEPHAWQPPTVKALQSVVGSARNVPPPTDPSAAFAIYTKDVVERDPAVLRDLLEIRPAGPELQLNEVEASSSIVKHFVASAMSLGSLSPEAHQTITAGMNMLGARSNTGEGGEDAAVYREISAGVSNLPGTGGSSAAVNAQGSVAVAEPLAAPAVHISLNNKIKQIASGRFGVTAEYLAHAEEIEIKVAQGAKPGEGGQLPAHKVSGLIARLRHAQPGVALISPPPHHDIYSIEDLAQLIYDLKRVNPKAAVGVKLVSGCGVGTVAAGVAKAYADYVVIAGNTGGTGAAALSSIKYAGNPWELGLAEAQQVLMQNGMRGRVRLRTDGGLATARDVLVAALLGADEYAFGTAVLVALGCDMARQCHLNTCPTGIATQKPELRAKFRGKPEHIVRFFEELSGDLRHLLARYGLPSLEAAIGRSDLLEQVRFDGNLDLAPMLAQAAEGPRRWMGGRNDQPLPQPPIDEKWTAPALEAVDAGKPYVIESQIANSDRALGSRLAGELSLRRSQGDLHADVTFDLHGTAGQSFGAFAVDGMKLVLDGQANDFVGKGLSGGEIVIRPRGLAARDSGQHVILGNVALYGATSGKLFAAGRAGERFGVRNSGAVAVVEGVGDHGCEYMTGGTVVVLGKTGMNFGAGMTGGLAWVLDEDGSFMSEMKYHPEFIDPQPFDSAEAESQNDLKTLIEEHISLSDSGLAKTLLLEWADRSKKFVRLSPKPQA
ncbi:glutamate synthase-related protein [Edaphobacter sp. 12200R-103]|uniref:glutamate synthase-related protein n=1 Tax=Edaphobacter sp. 12200R-103 TaxID=2703788 RepID=UPI00138C05A3|nr:glutamate synthase-related protein [Edaphobacter sp. 12200R-103]QHS51125.1 glutamate synthase large subunit [Edaphobacter sp. 12200R-103]